MSTQDLYMTGRDQIGQCRDDRGPMFFKSSDLLHDYEVLNDMICKKLYPMQHLFSVFNILISLAILDV